MRRDNSGACYHRLASSRVAAAAGASEIDCVVAMSRISVVIPAGVVVDWSVDGGAVVEADAAPAQSISQ